MKNINSEKARPITVKLRKLSFMLLALLLLPLTQLSAVSASSVVSLNAIASTEAGQTVTITGSTSLTEVIIKVLRPNNSVVFYDIAQVTGGQFTSSFRLGTQEGAGKYKVIAGQLDQVAAVEFEVTAIVVPDPGTGTNPNPGTGTEPEPGTITGPDPEPGTPSPGPTVTPPAQPATPAPATVALDESSYAVSSATDASGRSVTKVDVDAGKLADAFKQLAAIKSEQGVTPSIKIKVANTAAGGAKASLPLAVLNEAAKNTPTATIDFETSSGTYAMPLRLLQDPAIAEQLGTDLADVRIEISIAAVPSEQSDKIKRDARGINTTQVGTVVEFTITATSNGESTELNDFGSTYVERTITLPGAVDNRQATVALYDPTTGQFSFVPAIFEGQADGSTKVVFKRNGNSIYTVLTSTRTFDDVQKHWAKADIELLASKLVVNGVSATEFAPEGDITRAEFTALLVRSLGLTTTGAASSAFADVNADAWYAGAIRAAVKAKLVEGIDERNFKPNATITREQMAVMVARAVSAAGVQADSSAEQTDLQTVFKDHASVSGWARDAVVQAVEAGIITGMTQDTFVPGANATRAQAVAVLTRYMQHAGLMK